ncbi:hypothetical protein C0J52_16183 [Blattella germanica]|nr:hypothetical protein C0J52_16183 [Blattella germanica]
MGGCDVLKANHLHLGTQTSNCMNLDSSCPDGDTFVFWRNFIGRYEVTPRSLAYCTAICGGISSIGTSFKMLSIPAGEKSVCWREASVSGPSNNVGAWSDHDFSGDGGHRHTSGMLFSTVATTWTR